MNSGTWLVWGMAGLLVVMAGCTHYYKVNDPAGNKEYYTTKVEESRSGAIKIKDARTGSIVTLQSSEVKEISEDEYQAALKKPAPVAPVAAPSPAGP